MNRIISEHPVFLGDALKRRPAEEDEEIITFKQVGGRPNAYRQKGKDNSSYILFLVAAILFGVYELVLKTAATSPTLMFISFPQTVII